jgi:putative protease
MSSKPSRPASGAAATGKRPAGPKKPGKTGATGKPGKSGKPDTGDAPRSRGRDDQQSRPARPARPARKDSGAQAEREDRPTRTRRPQQEDGQDAQKPTGPRGGKRPAGPQGGQQGKPTDRQPGKPSGKQSGKRSGKRDHDDWTTDPRGGDPRAGDRRDNRRDSGRDDRSGPRPERPARPARPSNPAQSAGKADEFVDDRAPEREHRRTRLTDAELAELLPPSVSAGAALAASGSAAPAQADGLRTPEILAPAGDMPAALAAFAAGADAVYLGLKHFSARMQAENFSTGELAALTDLAHSEGRRIYVAMNSMLKPGDTDAAGRLVARLARDVRPDALIVQDLGMLDLARQAGFAGEMHLSTLANITHPAALTVARQLGASRVILPRELNIDEIRACGTACPEGLDLEFFVHGALCYCVSGRCYWSSYMGGKSGLRGRCVQPCRRVYRQKGREGRFFSCLDLSLDVLAKTLLSVPHLASWKIEGRKKGPHYVYYAVSAYRLLRDNPDDPKARKQAEDILEMALGRPGTHARFLPQRGGDPTAPGEQTSSGLLAGKVGQTPEGGIYFRPRFELLPQDLLRIGYEDESWHTTLPVARHIPKAGTFNMRLPRHKTPKLGTPVFLIDRREQELTREVRTWQSKLERHRDARREGGPVEFAPTYPAPGKPARPLDVILRGSLPHGREGKAGVRPGTVMGLWLSPKALREVSRTLYPRISWWLPPVIWPDEEAQWLRMAREAVRDGARHFVLNAPWQVSLFGDAHARRDLSLTAGPFCNTANPAALAVLRQLGFAAAIVSPELPGEDMLALPRQSCLPLGVVLSGYWPMGVTRHHLEGLKQGEPFNSPKNEVFWARRYGQNTWIYPGWPLDIEDRRGQLEAAGYTLFVRIDEHPPLTVPEPRRTSPFNWDIPLL